MLFGRTALRLLEAALSTWGRGTGHVPSHAGGDLERVRLVMRELLASLQPRPMALVRAVSRCQDLGALWHLRGELMQALSAAGGEAWARKQMAAVDAVFLEVWPAAPVSRWQGLG